MTEVELKTQSRTRTKELGTRKRTKANRYFILKRHIKFGSKWRFFVLNILFHQYIKINSYLLFRDK